MKYDLELGCDLNTNFVNSFTFQVDVLHNFLIYAKKIAISAIEAGVLKKLKSSMCNSFYSKWSDLWKIIAIIC